MVQVAQASSVGQIQWLTLQESQLNRAIRSNNEEVIRLTRMISTISTDISTKEQAIEDCEAKLETETSEQATCQAFDDIRSMMRELQNQVTDLESQQNRASEREAQIELENNEYQTQLDYISSKKQKSTSWIGNANHISRN